MKVESAGIPAESSAAPPKRAAPRAAKAGIRTSGGRRSPEALQEMILQTATEEFAEHGFSGARIDRMSKTAGTVDRMIYYYFDKKEGLYQAVLERAYEDINHAMSSFDCPVDDPLEGIRQLIVHNWEYHVKHQNGVRLLMNENLLRGIYLKKSKKARRIHHPLLTTTGNLLVEGKKRNLIRQDADVDTTLLTILSLVFFYLSNQYTCGSWMSINLTKKSQMDSWIKHICEVVILSLAPVSGEVRR